MDNNSPWGELLHLSTVVNVIPYELVCDIMTCRDLASSNGGSNGGVVNGDNDHDISDDQEKYVNQLKRLSLQMDDYSDNLFTQMVELGHMSQIRRATGNDRRVGDRLTEGRVHAIGEGGGISRVGDSSVEGGLSNVVGVGVGAGIGVGGFHEEDLGVVARCVWQYLHHHLHQHGGRAG